MIPASPLPRAARPLVAFPSLLRENGFAVAPEQTMSFVEAVGLLGPNDMAAIHKAARATLAPPPERHAAFDALFRLIFLGQTMAAPAIAEDEDDDIIIAEEDGEGAIPEPEEMNEAGGEATGSEVLSVRQFVARDEDEALRRFRRSAPEALPVRRSHRRVSHRRGDKLDLRRTLRQAARNDGEIFELPRLKRKSTRRRIVLLIDISGSMKQQTDAYLRFAHALVRASGRIEVFTVGTRLTRVTRALTMRNRDRALERAGGAVADWDGGTRLGDALAAFLSIPRYAGFARGALAIVLSDGLERGDPATMTRAVDHLSRLAWKLVWLSPLAGGGDYQPETEAMISILPFLDRLGDASGTHALCDQILQLGRDLT